MSENAELVMMAIFGGLKNDLLSGDYDLNDSDFSENQSLVSRTADYDVEKLFKECDDLDKAITHRKLNISEYEFFDVLTEYPAFNKLFINYLMPSIEVLNAIYKCDITENCHIYQFEVLNKKINSKMTLDLVVSSSEYVSAAEFGQVVKTLYHAERPIDSNPNRILLSILPLDASFCDGSLIAKSSKLKQYCSNVVLNLNGINGSNDLKDFISYYKTSNFDPANIKLKSLNDVVQWVQNSDSRILELTM